MSSIRTIVVKCDICGDEMHHQANGAACFPCNNFIPADLFYRYAEHITLKIEKEEGRVDDRAL